MSLYGSEPTERKKKKKKGSPFLFEFWRKPWVLLLGTLYSLSLSSLPAQRKSQTAGMAMKMDGIFLFFIDSLEKDVFTFTVVPFTVYHRSRDVLHKFIFGDQTYQK